MTRELRALCRIRAAIAYDRCDGDSWYAVGVNDATQTHTRTIDRILREEGVQLTASPWWRRLLCGIGWHPYELRRERFSRSLDGGCTILVRYCPHCGDAPTWDR